eukprot:830667-Rhodomonas_salina.4
MGLECGMWDVGCGVQAEVIPNAVLHYCRDPENDGLEGEEGDDLGDDTDSDGLGVVLSVGVGVVSGAGAGAGAGGVRCICGCGD